MDIFSIMNAVMESSPKSKTLPGVPPQPTTTTDGVVSPQKPETLAGFPPQSTTTINEIVSPQISDAVIPFVPESEYMGFAEELPNFEKIPFEGKSPFGVKVEKTQALLDLLKIAYGIRNFDDIYKITIVISIVRNIFRIPAYEYMQENPICKKIVCEQCSLAYAIEKRAGCCRYMAVLFHVLASVAEIKTDVFVYTKTFNTVLNAVIIGNQRHLFSIFALLTTNPEKSYIKNLRFVYENAQQATKNELGM